MGLRSLQAFHIELPGAARFDYDRDAAALQLPAEQFPGRLTCLTELQLPIQFIVHDIRSISNCVSLCDLHLKASTDIGVTMQRGEWGALASLNHLTRLQVDLDLLDTDEALVVAFYGVLRQLKRLRAVGANLWLGSFLPVLQSLTHLTSVHGGWELGDGVHVSGFVCPHISEVGDAWIDVPFRALPSLTTLSMLWVPSASFNTLTSYCTGLKKLALSGPHSPMTTGPEAGRISAMKTLAHLQHLTHLELSLRDDAQLMAFTSEAAAVGFTKLHSLSVRGPVSVFALMQLPRVAKELCLSVHGGYSTSTTFTVEVVRAWLVSLAVVPNVSLVLCTEEQHIVVEAARQWAARLKLPLPAVLKVSVDVSAV